MDVFTRHRARARRGAPGSGRASDPGTAGPRGRCRKRSFPAAAGVPRGRPATAPTPRIARRPPRPVRRRAQPLLAVRMGRRQGEGDLGRAARGVVPHARQGEELRWRGTSGRSRPRLQGEERWSAGPTASWRRRPSRPPTWSGLYGADPDRIRIVPPGVDPACSSRGPGRRRGAAAPHRRAPAAVRRAPPAPQGAGRGDPRAGRGRRAGAGAHAGRRARRGRRPDGAPSAHDEVARLMHLAASAGVGDRVVFFPPQPHERLADFYSAAEAVLVPSRSESFGLVALEAQACGTPVIAAAVGGLRYWVRDGVRGLVPGHDPGRTPSASSSCCPIPRAAGGCPPRRPSTRRGSRGRPRRRGSGRLPRAGRGPRA